MARDAVGGRSPGPVAAQSGNWAPSEFREAGEAALLQNPPDSSDPLFLTVENYQKKKKKKVMKISENRTRRLHFHGGVLLSLEIRSLCG